MRTRFAVLATILSTVVTVAAPGSHRLPLTAITA